MARRRPPPDALSVVRQFLRAAHLTATTVELASALSEATQALGFRHYALVQHGPLPPRAPQRLDLDNYPQAWRERFIGERLDLDDPVQRACRRMTVGFTWNELPDLIALSPRQRALLDAARRHGLGEGFTVPLHQPSEPAASCSFAVDRGRPFPARRLFAAQLLGQLAFATARRITGLEVRHGPGLSPRQRECVLFMAQGKTDWEIGRILGLSEETVTGYLNAARARYGVARRTQLAIAAIHDGEIGFDEVLGR